ncbi:protein ANKUB1-like [Octopus sinensis]|uniref:Protein ANKUB1-like n=1 Tax=Octopus sinensis TaxID=2607531 RepID=A0A6P7U1E4_9MOLL|nr:protein ANKUB1-like [Octopus sinensis]
MCTNDMDSYYFKYKGGKLENSWRVKEIIILNYSRVTVMSRHESNTSILIQCDVPIPKMIELHKQVDEITVAQLREIMSERTGIPVCLIYILKDKKTVLFDQYNLVEYGITRQTLLEMKVISEWEEFVKMVIVRQCSWVEKNLSSNPVIYNFQIKVFIKNIFQVALYLGTWYNLVDLIIFCLELRAKPCESISSIPGREWCISESLVDTLTTPAHLAAKLGNLRVLKLFVRQNISCLLSKNKTGRSLYSEAHFAKNYDCCEFILRKIIKNWPISRTKVMKWIIIKKILKWYCNARKNISLRRGIVKLISCDTRFRDVPLLTGIRIDGLNYPIANRNNLNKSTDLLKTKSLKTRNYISTSPFIYFDSKSSIGREQLEIVSSYSKRSYLDQDLHQQHLFSQYSRFPPSLNLDTSLYYPIFPSCFRPMKSCSSASHYQHPRPTYS